MGARAEAAAADLLGACFPPPPFFFFAPSAAAATASPQGRRMSSTFSGFLEEIEGASHCGALVSASSLKRPMPAPSSDEEGEEEEDEHERDPPSSSSSPPPSSSPFPFFSSSSAFRPSSSSCPIPSSAASRLSDAIAIPAARCLSLSPQALARAASARTTLHSPTTCSTLSSRGLAALPRSALRRSISRGSPQTSQSSMTDEEVEHGESGAAFDGSFLLSLKLPLSPLSSL